MSVLGSSVNYTCKSTIASSGIQWVHNGTVLKNETSEFLNITNVQWNETGMYYCVTTTKNVSVESDRGYLIMSESGKQLIFMTMVVTHLWQRHTCTHAHNLSEQVLCVYIYINVITWLRGA